MSLALVVLSVCVINNLTSTQAPMSVMTSFLGSLGITTEQKIKFHIPNGFRPFSPYLVGQDLDISRFRPVHLIGVS